jgi:hypothetical protein
MDANPLVPTRTPLIALHAQEIPPTPERRIPLVSKFIHHVYLYVIFFDIMSSSEFSPKPIKLWNLHYMVYELFEIVKLRTGTISACSALCVNYTIYDLH